MQTWQYGFAVYDGTTLEAHRSMEEMTATDSFSHFLDEAGEKGWELCGVLPSPTVGDPDGTLTLIFKRSKL